MLNNNLTNQHTEGADYFCFHDVDTLPVKADPAKNLSVVEYTYNPQAPTHLNVRGNRYHHMYNFIGGAIMFTRDQYEKVNGFGNNFYGWG